MISILFCTYFSQNFIQQFKTSLTLYGSKLIIILVFSAWAYFKESGLIHSALNI